MAKGKQKTTFFCKECGFESPKWLGQCPGCKEWDSFVEEPVVKTAAGRSVTVTEHREPSKLSEIVTNDEVRTLTGIGELDRVLGGGIVTGSLVLVGGDPGIGKSTLLLQSVNSLQRQAKMYCMYPVRNRSNRSRCVQIVLELFKKNYFC